MIKNLLRIYEKKSNPKKLKNKNFFSSGNPITVFVSPYNYFSITPIAMVFFFPQSSFYKDYTLQIKKNQNKSQLVMT
jgi:hypothetical protein